MLPAFTPAAAARASLPRRGRKGPIGGFRTLILYCVVALGLAFVPVANALNMAAIAAPQQPPSCHAPAKPLQHPDGKCCQTAGQCHCAMAVCLPTDFAAPGRTPNPSAHPQTACRFAVGQTAVPETPPPIAS